MPAKNRRKQYLENGYYHIYNRGVEKRIIFLDKQDYSVFLSYLKEYLLPKNEKLLHDRLSEPNLNSIDRDNILKTLSLNNFYEEIILLAFCLMPNHFHFFVKQKSLNTIDKFMNSLCTRYSMYFNKKYKRVGSLYQGTYKAVLIKNDSQFLHLSRYIHKQALAFQGQALEGYDKQPSSYSDYLGVTKNKWINSEEVLSFFSNNNHALSYENFVKENDNDDYETLGNLTLEEA